MNQSTHFDEAPSTAALTKPLYPLQARNRPSRRPGAEFCLGLAIVSVVLLTAASVHSQTPLAESLGKSGFKIVYESYVDDNSDLYVMSADGSGSVKLTNTPKEQEHYPQVSPDGKKLCFVSDVGEGRETVRSVYLMDIDGSNRKKVADHAREPFWSPDGKVIGFLPQEFPKFDIIDFSTRGMSFYDLATGKVEPHVNTTNLHHLYNPSWSANGKWIAATVHAGMGFDHAILLIEAHGKKIIDLKIHGCRPCFSPDGKRLAWGPGDHELAAAPINLDADQPAVGNWVVRIEDKPAKIYHIDWSPDGQLLAFSRGPDIGGDPSKPGTHQAAAEIHGVYGKGWNIGVVRTDRASDLNLSNATSADFHMLTTNGFSNKEPSWFQPRR